jgi:D-beta-D-heptose 7-phosphate kinase/D-beta-D-heptose 1-phosphate adenosyltransferase
MDDAVRSQQMALIESFDQARICCVGDVMLDQFVYGDVSRISPEAPIPVMKRARTSQMLGGAGNVVRNLISLGASACFISVIGDDAAGHAITFEVGEQDRLEPYLITDASRKTTQKTRFVCGSQQLLRVDDEDASPMSAALEDKLLSLLAKTLPDYGLLLLSDYAKGVLSERVVRESIALANKLEIPVFIDPKRADASLYAGATLLSPNLKEMALLVPELDVQDGEAIHAFAQRLCEQHNITAMAVTRGAAGMSLVQADANPANFAAQARAVYDVSGAGDTVIATLAVAHAAGADLRQAAALANCAAGIAVSRAGTATVYRTDLKAALHHQEMAASQSKLVSADMAANICDNWREEGHTIGFTNGCFDLLHVGHLQSLKEAKSHCDKLVVAINADASVKRLKGDSRPINAEMDRADLLAGLGPVDLVVIFREDTPEELLKRLRPDVLMKGEDYTIEDVVGGEFVRSYGGKVQLLSIKDGHSSSQLIEKSKQAS